MSFVSVLRPLHRLVRLAQVLSKRHTHRGFYIGIEQIAADRAPLQVAVADQARLRARRSLCLSPAEIRFRLFPHLAGVFNRSISPIVRGLSRRIEALFAFHYPSLRRSAGCRDRLAQRVAMRYPNLHDLSMLLRPEIFILMFEHAEAHRLNLPIYIVCVLWNGCASRRQAGPNATPGRSFSRMLNSTTAPLHIEVSSVSNRDPDAFPVDFKVHRCLRREISLRAAGTC